MSASLGEAVLDLTADNVKLKDSLGDAQNVVSRALGGIGTIAKGALTLGLGVAAGAVGALGGVMAIGMREAMGYQDAVSQIDAVLKSTGGAAGVTRQSLLDMAGAMSLTTKFGEEEVMAGESLLLTFTSIGKDVFPDATQTILDMSQALGQDLKSSAIQLGKALQDPTTGITALRRVGVNFNDAQVETIKGLVASGRLMDAQTLILKELKTEFGGSAEAAGKTFGGQLTILKNRLLEAAEGIGLALMPAAQDFMGKVVMPLVPRIEKLATAFATLISGGARGDVFRAIREALTGLVPDYVILNIFKLVDVIGRVGGIVQDLLAGRVFQAIREALTGIVPDYVIMQILAFIRTLQTGLSTNLPIALQTLANFWTTTLQPAIMQVINLIVTNWPTVQNILIGIGAGLAAFGAMGIIAGIVAAVGVAIAALASPVSLIAIAVGVLTAAWLNNWGGIRDTLTAFWVNTAQPILAQLWAWLQINVPIAIQTLSNFWTGTLLPAINAVWAWMNTTLLPLLAQLWAWLQVNVPIAIQTLSTFWSTVLLPAIMAVWTWITTTLLPLHQTLWNWLSVNLPIALQFVADVWTNVLWPAIMAVWAWMNDILFPFLLALENFFSAVFYKAVEAMAGLWQKVLLPAFTAVWNFLNTYVLPILKAIGDYLVKTFTPAFQTISTFLDGFVKGVLTALYNTFNNIWGVIRSVIGAINDLAEKIRNLQLPSWLKPGSPTPFEMGLRGIASALDEVNARLPELNANLNVNGGNSGGMSSSQVTNDYRTTISLTARYQHQTLTSLGDTVRLLALARS